jgi:hypothetical protein
MRGQSVQRGGIAFRVSPATERQSPGGAPVSTFGGKPKRALTFKPCESQMTAEMTQTWTRLAEKGEPDANADRRRRGL